MNKYVKTKEISRKMESSKVTKVQLCQVSYRTNENQNLKANDYIYSSSNDLPNNLALISPSLLLALMILTLDSLDQ